MNYIHTHVIPLFLGLIIGSLGVTVGMGLQKPTSEDHIAEYYQTENAVLVSPHGIRKLMAEGRADEFVLVDLRSSEEYEKEHIITAINIPAYSDANTSAYGEVERIVAAFQEIKANNPNKDIIVYCYSHACMTGRKVGKMLTQEGIFVKHLGIGWNEWRYQWTMWNHDGEKPSSVENYVSTGTEPGTPKMEELITPCSEGSLGC
jgi:rhodanese-related sulfurtransferase